MKRNYNVFTAQEAGSHIVSAAHLAPSVLLPAACGVRKRGAIKEARPSSENMSRMCVPALIELLPAAVKASEQLRETSLTPAVNGAKILWYYYKIKRCFSH